MEWRKDSLRAPWIHFKRLAAICIGAFIVAASINSMILPNKIADGGVTGIAIIIHYLSNLSVSKIVIILNIPLFIVGWKMVGRVFLIYSMIGVGVFSLALDLTKVIPNPTSDPLLACIFAGVVSGIGMGIIFRSRGSLGGTDILAVFFSRTTSFSVGQVLMVIDALIFVAAAIFLGPERAMYAMIYMFIATKVIDMVQEGINPSKSVLVVTQDPQGVAKDIMEKLDRGVTLFQAKGAYSNEDKEVVYCVINRTEMSQIKEIIRNRDAKAFLSISDVPEVVGEGFSAWKGH
ncbi:MAG: YitT family protein [Desulfitobacterium sp.]